VVTVTAVTVVGLPTAFARKGRDLFVGMPELRLAAWEPSSFGWSVCNVRGATAAVMRYGSRQGEFFEGYETRSGKVVRAPSRPSGRRDAGRKHCEPHGRDELQYARKRMME